MTFLLITIGGALFVLGYWALILWLGSLGERPHLEREEADRIFGDKK